MDIHLLPIKRIIAVTALASCGLLNAAQLEDESDIKFAFYSSAWGENTDDGLRLVALNQTENEVQIDSITFLKDEPGSENIHLNTNLKVPPMGYADAEFVYLDLLADDECIERTMNEDWKLVEVSNYTLNPSVRNLIIENTDSFRIYQCVENVTTNWTDLTTGETAQKTEWVLFHFESRAEY